MTRSFAKASRQFGFRRHIVELRRRDFDDIHEDLEQDGAGDSTPGVTRDSRAESVQEINLARCEADRRRDADRHGGHRG